MQRIKWMCLAALIVLVACQSEPNPERSDSRTKLVFEAPVSMTDLDRTLLEAGIQIEEFSFMQGDVRGGFRLRHGEDFSDGLARFQGLHLEFLNSVTTEAQAGAANAAPADAQRLEEFAALLSMSKETFTLDELVVLDVTLDSEDEALLVQSQHGGRMQSVQGTYEQNADSKNGVVYSNSHESWAPYGGTSKVTQGVSYQTFYFNNISSFGSTRTYEHEVQVYNRAYTSYAGYWSSNLPSAYLDTEFGDNNGNNIRLLTVGSAQASSLATYSQYYTYMSLSPGLATSADVRVKGQIGHRYPTTCYSTWCVWGDATTSSMTVFTAPNNGISWQY